MMTEGHHNILITYPKKVDQFVAEWKKWKPDFFDGVNTLFELLLNNPEFCKLDHSHLKSSIAAGMKLLAET